MVTPLRIVVPCLVAALSACEKDEPPPPRLPPGVLQAAAAPTNTTGKSALDRAPVETRNCPDAPHAGLENVRMVLGLDQVQTPMFIPDSYDPREPPPLLVVALDRYVNAPAWLKHSGVIERAGQSGFGVIVVHRMFSDVAARDLNVTIEATVRQVCFDEKRIVALGSGNGAAAVVELPCTRDVRGIVTTSSRPQVRCDKAVPHLHFEHEADQSTPADGASRRALSSHEERIQSQGNLIGQFGVKPDKNMMAREAGEKPSPCPPPDGIASREEFVKRWCEIAGCDPAAGQAGADGCTVYGAGFESCTVAGGRFWTPDYAPANHCWGPPATSTEFLTKIFGFYDGVLKD